MPINSRPTVQQLTSSASVSVNNIQPRSQKRRKKNTKSQPTAWDPLPAEHDYHHWDDSWDTTYQEPVAADNSLVLIAPTTKKRSKTQHDFLNEWVDRSSAYLAVLLDHESLPHGSHLCACSSGESAHFVCGNCVGPPCCSQCIVLAHIRMPLHKIKQWNGKFLQDCTLSDLGLVVQVGHNGLQCPTPRGPQRISVVHIDGFHVLSISFCGCESTRTPDIQLFQSRLFSASIENPKTAFTFSLLEHFRILNLEGKGSAHTYMESLYRLTNNEGSVDIPDRIREFRRVCRQWSYLVARRDAGSYVTGDTTNLQPVGCLQCPACPQPGVNLPLNWQDLIPIAKQWLVRRYVHFDANFRLTLLKHDNRNLLDRMLWADGGFFADPLNYRDYIASGGNTRQDQSDCSNYRATNNSSRSRFNRLEVTGLAGGVCRHECAIPQGFVDLQKGERYYNSDFAISCIINRMPGIAELVLTYDIACQYRRNFAARFNALAAFLRLPPHLRIIFLVPKFHLAAHKEECRYRYSLNYCKKVGRTDGEAIERLWSGLNHLSGSTSRMTPGSRVDTLNFHLNYWNWRKTCKMATTLSSRLRNAQEMRAQHEALITDLRASLGEEKAAEWSQLEDDYEMGQEGRSIYQTLADQAPTRAETIQKLTRFDAPPPELAIEDADGYPALALWVNDGLDIEEYQKRLEIYARSVTTNRQRLDVNRKRTTLAERMNIWRARAPEEINPEVDEEDDPVVPERRKLPLPSTFPPSEQLAALQQTEKDLREAQAFDYLRALRTGLAEEIAVLRHRDRHARGYDARLRSNSLLDRIKQDINFNAGQYRIAYAALEVLGGVRNPELMPLLAADVSAANVFRLTRELGRGYNSDMSWIWRQTAVGEQAQDENWLDEMLRVRFLEVKVNHDRWIEECELVQAEIAYTYESFRHRNLEWLQKAERGQTEGEIAHANAMAHVYSRLAQGIRAVQVQFE